MVEEHAVLRTEVRTGFSDLDFRQFGTTGECSFADVVHACRDSNVRQPRTIKRKIADGRYAVRDVDLLQLGAAVEAVISNTCQRGRKLHVPQG